jgi:cytochrome c551/c552
LAGELLTNLGGTRSKVIGAFFNRGSLTEISQAYQGKAAQLIQYLNGESEAIVRPAKSNLMKSKIAKTKNLADAERKAVADFILRH